MKSNLRKIFGILAILTTFAQACTNNYGKSWSIEDVCDGSYCANDF